MNELFEWLMSHIVTISEVLTAVAAVWVMIRKMYKGLMKPLTDIKTTNAEQTRKLDRLTEDVARIQGNLLNDAHEKYVRQGWCPSAKKSELQSWHKAYTSAGHNHLADHYLDDIINLP